MSLVRKGLPSHELCWLNVGFQETCIFWEGGVIVAPHFLSRRESFEVVRFSVQSLASLCSGWLASCTAHIHGKALTSWAIFQLCAFISNSLLSHCSPLFWSVTHFIADPLSYQSYLLAWWLVGYCAECASHCTTHHQSQQSWGRGRWVSELGASLVYIVISKLAIAMQ